MPVKADESSNARLINRENELSNKVMDEIEQRGEVITPNKVQSEIRKIIKHEQKKEIIIQPEFDENILTEHKCPSCGYEW